MAKVKNIPDQNVISPESRDLIVLEADGVDDVVVTTEQANRMLEHPHNDVAGWRVKKTVDADNRDTA